MERTFTVVLVPQSEGGFFIECPSLPGCSSEGETVQDAMENIREAIGLAIEDMQDAGDSIDETAPPLTTQIHVST